MEKRYDHTQAEPAAQKKWESEGTYTPANNPGTLYSIDTPPPTVSGSLHIGHIFSYTQTDIIARYKRMSGYSVFYPFGFDDNGLPTEKYVEKKKKIRAHQLPRSEFIKLCLEQTHEVKQEFQSLWQRMGLSVDWQYSYSTISDSSRKISQASFLELHKKGFIYRKDEPAIYCPTCRTSVAQAELDDKELPSFFNDIVFQDANGNDLTIGTTRPELLPSCVALLFHPNDERYTHLANTKATVPLFGFEVPIIADDQVSIEKGTGLVMCCTFGDKTDIEWFKKHNLPYKQSIGFDGKFIEGVELLAQLKVSEARQKIIDILKEKNLLLRQQPITHAVGVHERCKKEIEFVVLPQWFIAILPHKEKLVALADQINWHPSFMKARYIDWVQNLNWDWCISRQRFYGIPFPVWHCNACDELLFAETKDLPIDPQERAYPGGKCTKCSSTDIRPDTDVMDTWNTSSISPYLVQALLKKENELPFIGSPTDFLPMSMRPQAHDIIRTWAFYTIAKTWMHQEVIPWKDIVISGHVLSDAKEKLSKSKGNSALHPENLLQKYPADAIRYWTASGRLGHDVAFSENQLKIGLKLMTKLWNACRFAKTHIEALEKPQDMPQKLGVVNEWLLHNATTCFKKHTAYFDQNEPGLALDTVEQFFWNDLCDNYLEFIKHQLFNPDEYSADEVRATRWTLYQVCLRVLQLYAPYMPHITENMYALMFQSSVGTASLHQTQYAKLQTPHVFTKSAEQMATVAIIVAHVRKLKSEHQLSLNAPIAQLTVYTNVSLDAHTQLISGVTHAQNIQTSDAACNTTKMEEVDGVWHAHICMS